MRIRGVQVICSWQIGDDGVSGDLVPIIASDILVCYLTVFVDDEYGRGCKAVAEEVKDVVCLGY